MREFARAIKKSYNYWREQFNPNKDLKGGCLNDQNKDA